jgi:fluoride exporter
MPPRARAREARVSWLLVAAGSAAGGVCRWLLVGALQRPAFPTGTLAVNALGSLLVGWLAARLGDAQAGPAATARLLLVTGFCGGFTTFSAFSLETLRLAQDGRGARALGYVAASLALGLAAVAVGWMLGRRA